MKLKRHNDYKPEVATSSLNDIMFFLLLFFLIIATFANPNVIKLMLPKAHSSQTISKKLVNLSITKDKQYYIEKAPIPRENLESELLKIKGKTEDVTIVIRADGTLTVQDLVDVLQIGSKVQIRMLMATQKSQ